MFSLPRAFSLRTVARRSAISLGISLTASCAYLPIPDMAETDASGETGQLGVADELAAFFNASTEAVAQRFAETPWGEDVLIEAGPVYYAATGTSCRRVAVVGAVQAERMLACVAQTGRWQIQRLVVSEHGDK